MWTNVKKYHQGHTAFRSNLTLISCLSECKRCLLTSSTSQSAMNLICSDTGVTGFSCCLSCLEADLADEQSSISWAYVSELNRERWCYDAAVMIQILQLMLNKTRRDLLRWYHLRLLYRHFYCFLIPYVLPYCWYPQEKLMFILHYTAHKERQQRWCWANIRYGAELIIAPHTRAVF